MPKRKRTFIVHAFDGDFRTRFNLADHRGDHGFRAEHSDEATAMRVAEAFIASHPPLAETRHEASNGQPAGVWVEDRAARGGFVALARWEARRTPSGGLAWERTDQRRTDLGDLIARIERGEGV